MKKIFGLIAFILIVTSVGLGQVNTATLSGTITDSTGAVIPQATATLKNVNTGVGRTTASDSAGRYTFDFVPVGTYRLSVSSTGFQASQAKQFPLVAGQNVNAPVTLQTGEVQQQVTVSEEALLIDTQNAGQTDSISSLEVNKLPVPRQDWSNLLQLSTGAMKPSTGTTAAANSAQGSGISLNGLPTSGYNLSVDGTNATSNPEYTSFSFYQSPNIINTINNDAIQEVSLTKGIQPATIGNTVSGNINIITKSGGNQFHGTLNYINQEALYDARNQFLTTKPGLTFNQYGGSIGGPVLHDKLFFFFSYEGARSSSATVVSGTVPTPYLASISPAAYQSLFALFPQVAQPLSDPTAVSVQYSGAGATRQYDGNGVIRLDYSLSPKDTLAVRYIRARPYLFAPNLLPTNSRTTVAHTDAVNGNYTHVGKVFVWNTRIGFNQLLFNRDDQGFNAAIPLATFLGINSKGATLFLQHGNYITAEQAVAFVKGKNNIQAGFIFQRQDASRYKLVTPSITYSSQAQFLANTPSSTQPHLYVLPPDTPQFVFNDYQYGGYVQDDLKLTENLTLNLGFRYDHFTVPREVAGRFFNRGVDPAAPALGPGFGPFRPSDSIFDADYKLAQPRVGFAYTPYSNGKTVLRGGFGMFYANHTIFQGITGVAAPSGTLPFFVTLDQNQTAAAGLKYPIDPTQYPQMIAKLQSLGQLSSNLPNSTINSHNPYPYSMQWQLGVEQQFTSTLAMELVYVGTRGMNLDLFESKNDPDRTTYVAPRPNYGSFDYFTTGDNSKYHALQARLTKQMSHGLMLSASYVWSKTLTFGDADVLQAGYVQDNNNIRGEYGLSPYDIRDRFTLHGVWMIPIAEWTRTHGVVAKTLLDGWEVSGVFTGQTGAPANLTNPASTYPADRPDRLGGPMYVSGYRSFANKNPHQYLNCTNIAAAAKNCGQTQSSTLSPAFAVVPMSPLPTDPAGQNHGTIQARPGNLPRNGVILPGYENLDATLAKTFTFPQAIKLRLHMDAFNAFNHTNLNGLNTAVNSSTFGQLTTATPRSMQIGAQVTF